MSCNAEPCTFFSNGITPVEFCYRCGIVWFDGFYHSYDGDFASNVGALVWNLNQLLVALLTRCGINLIQIWQFLHGVIFFINMCRLFFIYIRDNRPDGWNICWQISNTWLSGHRYLNWQKLLLIWHYRKSPYSSEYAASASNTTPVQQ